MIKYQFYSVIVVITIFTGFFEKEDFEKCGTKTKALSGGYYQSKVLKYDKSISICIFRSKPATDSGINLPPVPAESCHPFRSKPAT